MPPTPSTIPTSFVPKQPVSSGPRFSKTGGNTFLVISLVILGISIAGAIGVFAYEHYLTSVREGKAAAVKAEQDAVDPTAIEEFVRMRDRLRYAGGVLDAHVAASGFFDLLESVTLQTVRFDTLSFTLAEDRSAEIQMSGVARTFNALAAQSTALAGERLVKRAIFSDIAVDETNDTVTFSLTAELDPRLLAFTEEDLVSAPAPADVAPVEDASSAEALPAETDMTAPLP